MQENKLGVMPIRKLIWNMSLPIIASMLAKISSMAMNWIWNIYAAATMSAERMELARPSL